MNENIDPGLRAEPQLLPAVKLETDPAVKVDKANPRRGVFFDERLDLRDPEGQALTNHLTDIFVKTRAKKRFRGAELWRLRIRKLAANALRAHFFRHPPSVLYFRGAEISWYEDKPGWMRFGALGVAVDTLIAAELFKGITGKKMPYYSATPSYASSYWATDALIELANQHGVSNASIISSVHEDDLVQLYTSKTKPEFDRLRGELLQARKGKRIWFDQTDETESWSTSLAAINTFYKQHSIELGLSEKDLQLWLGKQNSDLERKGAHQRAPELFATDLYRVFNNGNADEPGFESGGRLFGGWWMHLSEEARRAITINGEATVELDYANCHPRMLYHQRGLEFAGDLYRIPEITNYEAEHGHARDTFRPYIKWLMQVLINCGGRPELVPTPTNIEAPVNMKRKDVVQLIEAAHQPISEAFGTGIGLQLMRLESDIALEIISTGISDGWPVLSIHDSFISTIDREAQLRRTMVEVYKARLSHKPVVK